MAQAEDTELRDLVVEALEKNGSLAKIRALLRANIFLVFEDDYENIKQNGNLDNILKLPEGIFCLSLVHEFLEFCNLKNTLFVYMSESRQGKEYAYEGHSGLSEKLKLSKRNKEPVLVTLVKNVLQQQTKSFRPNEKHMKTCDNNYKEEQNSTYIVHEDSTSSTSHSISDNSSDEKNKLQLRLQLDNSDTDTSSDSTRGKTSSEYIPSEHILVASNQEGPNKNNSYLEELDKSQTVQKTMIGACDQEIKKVSSGSDSTSYVEIKPLSPLDKILFNTTGVPCPEEKDVDSPKVHSKTETLTPSLKYGTKSMGSNYINDDINKIDKQKSEESGNDLTEYSFDFTSPASGKKDFVSRDIQSSESIHDQFVGSSPHKTFSHENTDHKSVNSSGSVSTLDAADIISDKSYSLQQKSIERNLSQTSKSISNHSKKSLNDNNKLLDDDSGDFSESPIPSLSNLSLDIHSD